VAFGITLSKHLTGTTSLSGSG